LPGYRVVFLALRGDSRSETLGWWWDPIAMAIALAWHRCRALRHEILALLCGRLTRAGFLGQRALSGRLCHSLRGISAGHATLFGPCSSSCRALRETSTRPAGVDSGAASASCSPPIWGGIIVLSSPCHPEAGRLRPAIFSRPASLSHHTGNCVQKTQAMRVCSSSPSVADSFLLLDSWRRSAHSPVLSRQCFSTDVYSAWVSPGCSYAIPLMMS